MTTDDIIDSPLAVHASERPEASALVLPGGGVSWGELERRVASAAAGLAGRGVGEGVRVALLLPNGPDLVVLLLALVRLGAVACPLSTRLPAAGVADALQAASAALLVADAAPGGGVPTVAPAEVLRGPGRVEAAPWRLGRPATVVFTSGSTGGPKAALHSLGNHVWNARGSAANLPLGPGDRWLLSLPLYHVGGLAIVVRCLLAGAAVAVPAPRTPFEEALPALGVTHVSMVTTQLRRLLRDAPAEATAGLRAVLLGGSAMPPGLVDAAHARRLPVHTSYGLTEMASQVTATPAEASRAALATSGRVLPHRELTVSPDGEILVRGRTLFLGYLRPDAPGGLDPARDADGWFHTRDRGWLDADGRLHVVGRTDHMFVSGGENVQPEDVERALAALEGVERAVVVPVPDDEFGARPVAFVQGPAPLGALAARLEEHLPRFMIPTAFHPWPEALEGSGMKVVRGKFVERALQLRENHA